MKIIEITASIGHLVLSPEQIATRTPGIHVSAVIQYMKSCLQVQGKWGKEELENAGQLGRVFEVAVADALARAAMDSNRYVRPGEIECDGIIGSPDGIDTEEFVVIEYKVTYTSCRESWEIRMPWYGWQIKSYCHMLGCQRARLYILYLNGDYRPPAPQFKAYEMEFTRRELQENWIAIKNNAKVLKGRCDG